MVFFLRKQGRDCPLVAWHLYEMKKASCWSGREVAFRFCCPQSYPALNKDVNNRGFSLDRLNIAYVLVFLTKLSIFTCFFFASFVLAILIQDTDNLEKEIDSHAKRKSIMIERAPGAGSGSQRNELKAPNFICQAENIIDSEVKVGGKKSFNLTKLENKIACKFNISVWHY